METIRRGMRSTKTLPSESVESGISTEVPRVQIRTVVLGTCCERKTIRTQKSKIKNAEHMILLLLFVSRGCIFLELESELHFSIISIDFLVSNNQKKILNFLGKNGQKMGKKPAPELKRSPLHRCFPNASPHKSPYQRVAAVERLAPVERRPELCLPGSQTFSQICIFIGCIFQQILECCDVVVVCGCGCCAMSN